MVAVRWNMKNLWICIKILQFEIWKNENFPIKCNDISLQRTVIRTGKKLWNYAKKKLNKQIWNIKI